METHVKVVGVLNIVFGALGVCLAGVLRPDPRRLGGCDRR